MGHYCQVSFYIQGFFLGVSKNNKIEKNNTKIVSVVENA